MPLSVKQGDPRPALNTRHSSLFSHPTPGVWGAGKSRFRSEAASQTRFFRASAGPALLSAAHSTARLQARLGARGRCVPGTSPVGRWFQPPAPPPDSRPCLFRSANALSPPRAWDLCPVPHTAGSSRPSGLAFGGPASEGHPTVPLKRVRAREAGGAAGVQEDPCILSAPKTALPASRRVGPPPQHRAAPEAAGHQLAVPQFHSGPTPSPGN